MLNRIKLQLILAMFWFISAYLAAGALLPSKWSAWEWAWRCAWLNLIIGLLSLLLITRTDYGDRMFYKGPQGDQPGMIQVALLWAIPFTIFCLALIWWVARLIGIFNW